MQHLNTLDITINYTRATDREGQVVCRDMLRPLLNLRGMRDFRLEVAVLTVSGVDGVAERDVELGDETRGLVSRIERKARLSRGGSGLERREMGWKRRVDEGVR